MSKLEKESENKVLGILAPSHSKMAVCISKTLTVFQNTINRKRTLWVISKLKKRNNKYTAKVLYRIYKSREIFTAFLCLLILGIPIIITSTMVMDFDYDRHRKLFTYYFGLFVVCIYYLYNLFLIILYWSIFGFFYIKNRDERGT